MSRAFVATSILLAALACTPVRAEVAPERADRPPETIDDFASQTRAANAQRADLILQGKVESIGPQPALPGDTVVVMATLLLSQPAPASLVQRSVSVLIDGKLAERVGYDPSTAAAPVDPGVAQTHGSGVVDPRSVDPQVAATFVVRMPDIERRSGLVSVVLYSDVDQGWVPGATYAMELGSLPVASRWPPDDPWLIASSLLSIGTAGVLLYSIVRSRRQRRAYERELEAAKLERDSERKGYIYGLENFEARNLQVRESEQRSGDAQRGPPVQQSQALAEPSIPVIPESITEALIQKRLVLVLGAGVSVQGGIPTGAALWLQVLARMQTMEPTGTDAHSAVSLRDALIHEGSSRAIEAIVETYGRVKIASALQQIFDEAATQRSLFHEQIAQVACDVIVDLTFDAMTSRAFPKAEVFTPSRSDGLTAALREQRPCILKPYGDLQQPEKLALTPSDVRLALSRAPEFERALAGAFSSHSHLFLGVSLPGLDEYLGMLPPSVGSTSREHVAVMAQSSPIALWQAGPGKRFGIRIETYQPGAEHRELVTMLERWLAATAQACAQADSLAEVVSQQQPRLTRVTLENIGAFERLELDLSDSWTLFLGNNGGGKSTVLRAICVALAGNDPRAAKAALKLLRNGARSGRIQLEFGRDRIVTELVRDAAGVKVESPQVTPLQAGRLLVLAFPVLRGATHRASRGPREVPGSGPSVDDIAPMIEGVTDSRLDDLKQWIVNLMVQADVTTGGGGSGMLATLRSLIRELIPGQRVSLARVDRNTWTIWLETADGDVEFDAISQGMSSILNWVGVLLRRLYDVYPRAREPEKERALVLIDEIDAHLHPNWQRRLVEITRRFFPNVQIVATSHSPLLAGAVKQEELRIVERDPVSGKTTVSAARENLEGQRAEDILVSSLFALDTTRSPEAERSIKSYLALFENPSPSESDKAQMKDLKARLVDLNYGIPLDRTASAKDEAADAGVPLVDILGALPEQVAETLRSRLAGSVSSVAASEKSRPEEA
jgi:hypothetical protein